MEHPIAHEEQDHRGAFFVEQDGRRVAELTYSRAGEALVIIDNTWVDPSLGGQGLGRRLLDAAVEWARESGTKVMSTCPFARAEFLKDPELQDVLA